MTVRLDGIELVVFDKDGTIIAFGPMWSGWAVALADRLRMATSQTVDEPLFAMLGYDPVSGTVLAGGGLAATPMARLRERTRDVLVGTGLSANEADRALRAAWQAPDPVALARPLRDLRSLFDWLHETGRLVAVATSDDREPTERTLVALEISDLVDATVCADDGIAVKPSPEMLRHLCSSLGVPLERTAVVGDTPADLQMARSAGAGLSIGVLTGVGGRVDLEPFADLVIESVEQLREHLA